MDRDYFADCTRALVWALVLLALVGSGLVALWLHRWIYAGVPGIIVFFMAAAAPQTTRFARYMRATVWALALLAFFIFALTSFWAAQPWPVFAAPAILAFALALIAPGRQQFRR